jgi:hypothetical protein
VLTHQVNLTSIAVPSRPEGGSFSPSRQAVLILLAHVYALFPLIPTLTTAASYNFRLTEGFGKWWGIYCIDRASWWRIGGFGFLHARRILSLHQSDP